VRETLDSTTIHRVIGARALGSRVATWQTSPYPFNPFWFSALATSVRRERPDVLLVRDIPLAVPAIAVARRRGLPVILDVAENYPALIADWRRREGLRYGLGKSIMRNVRLAKWLESVALRLTDHIVVVSQESRDRLASLGVPEAKISVVGNTPDLSTFRPSGNTQLTRRFVGHHVLLYVGDIHVSRGLDVAIRAMPDVVRSNPRALLLLVGRGKSERELVELARSLGVEQHVRFEGWVDYRRVPDYILASDVCVLPLHRNEHIDTTLPNKLFEYLALGKPVIASDAPPMERVVTESRCGVVFPSGSVPDFARAVDTLNDSGRRMSMGQAARSAVETRFHWGRDLAVLEEVITQVCDQRASAGHASAAR